MPEIYKTKIDYSTQPRAWNEEDEGEEIGEKLALTEITNYSFKPLGDPTASWIQRPRFNLSLLNAINGCWSFWAEN